MPNWKKVIVSGSNAVLNHITSSGNISASGHILALEFIGGQGNSDVDTGTETVATATGATASFFDYVAKSGTNLRAGTVTSVTDGTNVEFNEVSTVDLGEVVIYFLKPLYYQTIGILKH